MRIFTKVMQYSFAAMLIIAPLSAQNIWIGPNGGNWSTGSNWSKGSAPASGDSVIFDNSITKSSYSVTLPTGDVSTVIKSLTITPSGGNTITVTLPSGNTNTAGGLIVGDGIAGNYDITLNSGATLINSSGASSGQGIKLFDVASTKSDRILINNGGVYIHNTILGDGGVIANTAAAPTLVFVAGQTEGGLFKYSIPGTASYTMSLGNRAFGCSVMLDRPDGAATITTAAISSAPMFYSDFTVGPNVTFTPNGTSVISFNRNITINGTATFTNTGGMKFNGGTGVTQILSGTGTITTVAIQKQTIPIVKLAMDLTINAAAAPTFTINGTLDCGINHILGNVNIAMGVTPRIKTALAVGINGNFTGTGTKNFGSGTQFEFNGTVPQVTGSMVPSTINGLIINNPAGVTLSSSSILDNTGILNLTAGLLNLNNNTLTINNNQPIALSGGSASSYVYGGQLIRAQAAAAGAYFFPIGTASAYRGVTVTFTDAPTAATNITANFTSGDPGSLGLPISGIVNYWPGGFWTISSDGTPGASYSLSIDVNNLPGIYNISNLRILKRAAGASWTLAGTANSGSAGGILTEIGITGFSEFGIGGDGLNPLPVELTSFTASAAGNNIKLKWITASEINSSCFVIERSSDKQTWIMIGKKQASGSSLIAKSYEYTDRISTAGKYSYRLKSVDADGSYKYSNAVEVETGIPVSAELIQNFPNPFNPSTNIGFQLAKDGLVSLKVYNILGEEVAVLIDGYRNAGYYNIPFNAGGLAGGVYFYKLNSNGVELVKKMNLIK